MHIITTGRFIPALVILSLITLMGCTWMPQLIPEMEEWIEVAEPPVLQEIYENMPDTEVVHLIRTAQRIRSLHDEEAVYRRALALLTAPHEQRHRWSVLLLLGRVTWHLGREDESEVWMREAYGVATRYHQPNGTAVFRTSLALGAVLYERGRGAEALELASQAEANVLDRIYSSEPQAVVDKIAVGRLLVALQEWQRGEKLLKEAVRWDYDSIGGLSDGDQKLPAFQRALALGSLGRVSLQRNDKKKAFRHFERALMAWDDFSRLTGSAHQEKANIHMLFGALLAERNTLYRASREYERAARTYELLNRPKDRAVAFSNLADVLIKQHEYEQARELLAQSYVILKSPPHPNLAYTAALYARSLDALNDYEAAEHVLSETLALSERGFISLEDAAYLADHLSALQLMDGRICEAQATAHKSMALLAKARPDAEWTEETLRPQLMWNGKRCTESIATQ